MLEALFGNKTVQKILIFIFVNGKGYGTQLHKSLSTPLTPIQKALNRLEKGSIITSYYEGKTRLYQFNPAYPLSTELEQLLKKAYTLLPAHEKKQYYIAKESRESGLLSQKNKMQVLLAFWERLMQITELKFDAKTKSKDNQGWHGKGTGEVIVTKESSNVLLFHEKGIWQGKQGGETTFSNVFRWTIDRHACVIGLEHLRHGVNRPVFLFYLEPSGKHSLSSVDSHLCEGDTYFGTINFDRYSLRLNWRIIGPKKNEELGYYYY